MKNILIIGHTNKMGGVETFIYNTTIASNKEKVNFDFMIHGYNHCVFEEEINKFYAEEKHIFFLPKYKKNPFKCIAELRKFYRENKSKYDVIHLETGSTSEILYLYPYVKKTKAKIIIHSHNGNGSSKLINTLFRPLINRSVDKRLACSDKAAEWLFGKKHKQDCEIVNNGVDTNRFKFSSKKRKRIRREYDIGDDTFVIGHIGRFSEQKNHDFLIDIFAKFLEKNPNAILMLIGVGELQENIIQKTVLMNIYNNVIFVGRKDNTEDYYCAFDLFLMPSLYEGLPIVGIEAQTSGVPCLFSDTISEQLKLTDHAIFFSLKKSADEWANKAHEVQCNIELRNKYEYEIIKKGFDIGDTVKRLEEIYLQL